VNVLDDVAAIAAGDPAGMLRHITGFADQLREAREIGRNATLSLSADGVTSIVVLGMGGSAIGGDLLAGYLAGDLAVPMRVVRDYAVPSFVGPGTLVIASSYSGDTDETLAAHRDATGRGARVVAVTTGGKLSDAAGGLGQNVVRIPAGLPPRAALGYSLATGLVILSRLGLTGDCEDELGGAIAAAERAARELGAHVPEDGNAAKELAAWFAGGFPVVYGTAPVTSVVASRWCGQISENAKMIAHRNELPEMNHNEIVGWSERAPFDGKARVVFLRDAGDHPRVVRRIGITRRQIEAAGAEVRDIESAGGTRLGKLFSLVLMGDYVSFYLAILSGIDPTPVEPIDRLKRALTEA